ncbi:hypothetical protein M5689_009831 [Euphorbia peplus]|nr:hypothetical protein M5689_009831 [Euphorbia peplus]
MERKKLFSVPVVSTMLLMLWLMISPSLACPPRTMTCEDCIVDQMKNGCPSCVPNLRCMTRCLWSGISRSNCIKKCNFDGGKPTLSECKKCVSSCKCSCMP